MLLLGLGIPKAICSYKGQSLISTTFDGSAGIILALRHFDFLVAGTSGWGLMKGAQVVLARDDRRQTPRIVSKGFRADLAPPFVKVTSRRRRVAWRIDGSVLIVNRHPSAFGESSRRCSVTSNFAAPAARAVYSKNQTFTRLGRLGSEMRPSGFRPLLAT